MLGGFRNIARAGLTLRTDHCGTLVDAAQRFTQVGGTADKRNVESVLVDVVDVVGGAEDFGFVHEVHAERLQHLRFDLMADAGLGHDGNVNGFDDRVDEVRVGHAGYTALRADISGHALKGHDGTRTGISGDVGLFGGDNVHDDAALELVCQASLDHARLSGCLMSGCCHGKSFRASAAWACGACGICGTVPGRPSDVTSPIVSRKADQIQVQFYIPALDHLAGGRLLSGHGPHPSPSDTAGVR